MYEWCRMSVMPCCAKLPKFSVMNEASLWICVSHQPRLRRKHSARTATACRGAGGWAEWGLTRRR